MDNKTICLKNLFFLFLLFTPGSTQFMNVLGQAAYPDVIKCGDFFYYKFYSAPALSRYYALTVTEQSYQARDGVLVNKVGIQITSNCENQTIDSLFKEKRAFRFLNIDGQPNPSIFNSDNLPDIIKCGEKILFLDYQFTSYVGYRNSVGGQIKYQQHANRNQAPQIQNNVNCQNNSINTLVRNRQTYNIATEVMEQNEHSLLTSMTGRYPDALNCENDAVLYIHSISGNKKNVAYRDITGDFQLDFINNGKYAKKYRGFTDLFKQRFNKCLHFSISELIKEGRALSLNTPQPKCPQDMKVQSPLVSFKVDAPPGFTVLSTPESNTYFPVGKTTRVNVKIKHVRGQIFYCQFLVEVAFTPPPDLTCPKNISQTHPEASYQAKAVSNSPTSAQITYDKAPGSKFPFGTTIVKVVAIDGYKLQAQCFFEVEITYNVDTLTTAGDQNQFNLEREEDNSNWIVRLLYASVLGYTIGLASVLIICFISHKSSQKCKKRSSRPTIQTALKDDIDFDSARKLEEVKQNKLINKKNDVPVNGSMEGNNQVSMVEDIE